MHSFRLFSLSIGLSDRLKVNEPGPRLPGRATPIYAAGGAVYRHWEKSRTAEHSRFYPQAPPAFRNPRDAVRHLKLAVNRLVYLETTGHGSIPLHGQSEIRKTIPCEWFEIERIQQYGLAPIAGFRPD